MNVPDKSRQSTNIFTTGEHLKPTLFDTYCNPSLERSLVLRNACNPFANLVLLVLQSILVHTEVIKLLWSLFLEGLKEVTDLLLSSQYVLCHLDLYFLHMPFWLSDQLVSHLLHELSLSLNLLIYQRSSLCLSPTFLSVLNVDWSKTRLIFIFFLFICLSRCSW